MSLPDLDVLAQAIGADRIVRDEARLDARRHDYWALSHVRDKAGTPAPRPGALVRPRSVEDVRQVLQFANERRIAVIPFGLGSGVVGGVIASPDAIVLDMGDMAAVRSIDPVNLLASFDAGHNGLAAEEAVAAQGLTIGHWPQSVAVSTVGGWVATRASGQLSTGYGNIEEIVHSIEAVRPSGDVVTLGKGPRASAGPDLRQLMLGSEGTLGVITGVTFSLRRAPEAKAVSCFEAPTMRAGFELQREIVQRGWRPPVMRQYDERESGRQWSGAKACLIMIAHEGPAALVEAERSAVAAMAAEAGVASAPGDVVDRWFGHRNTVPSWDALLSRGLVVDTVEVSADWTRIGDIYDDAVASLKQIEGLIAGSAHSSHVYRSGLNLYFTFAVQTSATDQMEPKYLEGWRRIMESTARHGGSVSHHHGIGRVRREWLTTELGDTGVSMLRRVKAALDPNGIMNPGVLIPDG
jgi:alkyldihydroxyacetonephosphate synthase